MASAGDPEERMGVDYQERMVFERLPTGAQANYYLEPAGGRVRVSRVVVTHPRRGVSGRDLRQFSPALAVEMFEKWLREDLSDPRNQDLERYAALLAVAHGDVQWLEGLRHRWRGWERALDRLRADNAPKGMTRRTARLLTTAAAYVEAIAKGERSPNAAVARYLETTPHRVTEDLRAARKADLLTPAPGRGVPGGELTDKAVRLLEQLGADSADG